MSQEFSEALNDSLDLMLRGEDIEGCLRRFPQHAEELVPLLEVARATMRVAEEIRPDTQLKARNFQRFSAALRELKESPSDRRLWPPFGFSWMGLARPMAAALTLLVVFATGFGATAASASAVPGEPLYWVKTTRENLTQRLPRSDVDKASYEAKLAQVRSDEIRKLIARRDFNRADSTTKRMSHNLEMSAKYAGVTVVVNPIEMPFKPAAQIGWSQASRLRFQLERDRAIFRSNVRDILAKLAPEDRRRAEHFVRRTELRYWLLINAMQNPSPTGRPQITFQGR